MQSAWELATGEGEEGNACWQSAVRQFFILLRASPLLLARITPWMSLTAPCLRVAVHHTKAETEPPTRLGKAAMIDPAPGISFGFSIRALGDAGTLRFAGSGPCSGSSADGRHPPENAGMRSPLSPATGGGIGKDCGERWGRPSLASYLLDRPRASSRLRVLNRPEDAQGNQYPDRGYPRHLIQKRPR
ncbi:hypothetical protein L209DRAFT_58757 [Thermothelomyces heterothallicus CBS 203.75]